MRRGLGECGQSLGRVWREFWENEGRVWRECGESVGRLWEECWESVGEYGERIGRVWGKCVESVERVWEEFKIFLSPPPPHLTKPLLEMHIKIIKLYHRVIQNFNA